MNLNTCSGSLMFEFTQQANQNAQSELDKKKLKDFAKRELY